MSSDGVAVCTNIDVKDQNINEKAPTNSIKNYSENPTLTTELVKDELSALEKQRASLPVGLLKDSLLAAIKENPIIVCIGETGSGKTTQIPQFLLEAGYGSNGMIGITQPRRVAAVAVAKRVSQERGCRIGEEVGYSIRFEDKTSNKTKLKFMTDGTLVRECLEDSLLSKYSVIMLDEAHERSISTDILFGLLKQTLSLRKDFKILVTSATLDCEKFSLYFSNAPKVVIPGRSFPVDLYHSKKNQVIGKTGPISAYLQDAIDVTLKIHQREEKGHILVFLTGQEEIEKMCSELRKQSHYSKDLLIVPLYGALQGNAQTQVFIEPKEDVRKVVVATNIAETSVTIDNIKYVVDSGYVKQKAYDPKKGVESLVIVPISKVSAQQRAGRAGRTVAGKCYRLYSKQSYQDMLDESIPEIKRMNLINCVLYLKVLGINDVLGFDYLDPPEEDSLLDALKRLYVLGALDATGQITSLGKQMSIFPLEPSLSRILVESVKLHCTTEIITIVAMLSVENIYMKSYSKRGKQEIDDEQRAWSKFYNSYGDHLTYLQIYEAWKEEDKRNTWCEDHFISFRALRRADAIRSQLIDLMHKCNLPLSRKKASSDTIRQAVCSGYFMNAARRCVNESVYRCLSDDYKLTYLHPLSSLTYCRPPEYAVYHELVHTSKSFMRHTLSIKREWIEMYKCTDELHDLYQLSGRVEKLEKEDSIAMKENLEETIASKKSLSSNDLIEQARKRFKTRKSNN